MWKILSKQPLELRTQFSSTSSVLAQPMTDVGKSRDVNFLTDLSYWLNLSKLLLKATAILSSGTHNSSCKKYSARNLKKLLRWMTSLQTDDLNNRLIPCLVYLKRDLPRFIADLPISKYIIIFILCYFKNSTKKMSSLGSRLESKLKTKVWSLIFLEFILIFSQDLVKYCPKLVTVAKTI